MASIAACWGSCRVWIHSRPDFDCVTFCFVDWHRKKNPLNLKGRHWKQLVTHKDASTHWETLLQTVRMKVIIISADLEKIWIWPGFLSGVQLPYGAILLCFLSFCLWEQQGHLILVYSRIAGLLATNTDPASTRGGKRNARLQRWCCYRAGAVNYHSDLLKGNVKRNAAPPHLALNSNHPLDFTLHLFRSWRSTCV